MVVLAVWFDSHEIDLLIHLCVMVSVCPQNAPSPLVHLLLRHPSADHVLTMLSDCLWTPLLTLVALVRVLSLVGISVHHIVVVHLAVDPRMH